MDNIAQAHNNLSIRASLKDSYMYWGSLYLNNNHTKLISTPTYSNVNSPARSSWRPLSGFEFFSYSENIILDILSKREYLFRNLYNSLGYKTILPDYFISSPNNPLLRELQSLPNSIDPINISAESSRELFYTNYSNLNLSIIRDLLSNLDKLNTPFNLSIINNSLFTYLLGNSSLFNFYNTNELYKNQYRPLKKGVSNMVKLHATGAIAMPIETRLHLLASSKDVIHS
jgi:hypothetical protein